MKKPSIPSINIQDQKIAALLRPMKENIEILTGIRGDKLNNVYTTKLDPIDETAIKLLYEQVLREETVDQTQALIDIIKAMLPLVRGSNTQVKDAKALADKVNEIVTRLNP